MTYYITIHVCRLGKTVIFLACILSNQMRVTRPFAPALPPSDTGASSSSTSTPSALSVPASVGDAHKQSSYFEPGVEGGAFAASRSTSSAIQSERESEAVDSSTSALSAQVNETAR